MGCTPSLAPLRQGLNPAQPTLQQSTIKIDCLIDVAREKDKEATTLQSTQKQEQDVEVIKQMKNQELVERQQRIELLKESKRFMNFSIETTNYVNNALLALSSNPLLYDHSYAKLIGANKRILAQKQNRLNYLAKREQKAENELKKERQLYLKKSRSQYLKTGPKFKKSRTANYKQCKQNRSESNLQLLSKQRFSEKLEKIEQIILGSQLTIQ